jgi:branched-subunit amino acid transport protein AzlD
LLLFLALATIAGALAFYVFKRDRRYLRFITQVVKYTIFLLLGILVFYAFDRLVAAASVVN